LILPHGCRRRITGINPEGFSAVRDGDGMHGRSGKCFGLAMGNPRPAFVPSPSSALSLLPGDDQVQHGRPKPPARSGPHGMTLT
jgi:hypothetical protein